jgi:hypothetical protein
MREIYKPLAKIVIRKPYFEKEQLLDLLFVENVTQLKRKLDNPIFKEALFLASPYLFRSFIEWLDNKLEVSDSMIHAFLKYYIRMTCRPTPFGLFSGVGSAKIDTITNITCLESKEKKLSLDMCLLCEISAKLENDDSIGKTLKYYPNTSLYYQNGKYRYIEVYYVNSVVSHKISEVEFNEYIELVLDKSKDGHTVSELANFLVCDDIPLEDALGFIQHLVNEQVFVSEIDPRLTGDDYFELIIKKLSNQHSENHLLLLLKDIKYKLDQISSCSNGNIDLYLDLIGSIKDIGVKYDEKYIFQVDSRIIKPNSSVSENVLDWSLAAFQALEKLYVPSKKTGYLDFKERFRKKFEDEEIPLVHALDPDFGIPYKNMGSDDSANPLLKDILLGAEVSSSRSFEWNKVQDLLFHKYIDAIKTNKKIIKITDKELDRLDPINIDYQDSFSLLISIINENNREKIYLKGSNGQSANNLISRFYKLDDEIERLIKEIASHEKNLNPDAILAEIVHLPESRVGNVLGRPSLREYEIPLLCNSSLPVDKQINIEDLMISVRKNKLVLRSKRLDKIVIPRLSNAHNFSNSSIPIYQFLCAHQYQDKKFPGGFNWGFIDDIAQYLPRVEYMNTILEPARWKFKEDEIKHLYAYKDEDELKNKINKFRDKYELPLEIVITEGDNELYINLKSILMIKVFLDTIRTKKVVIISESLVSYEDSSIPVNQVVIPFIKRKKND